MINFENFALDHSTDIVADVARSADIHLAGRQEYGDPNIDEQATFDFSSDFSRHNVAFLDVGHQVFPQSDIVRFSLAQNDQAVRIFGCAMLILKVFNHDVD